MKNFFETQSLKKKKQKHFDNQKREKGEGKCIIMFTNIPKKKEKAR